MPSNHCFVDHTWGIDHAQLEEILDEVWQALDPNDEQALAENVEALPVITLTNLPYSAGRTPCFIVQDVPSSLIPTTKLSGQNKVPCRLCGKSMKLIKMREHIGMHILQALRKLRLARKLKDGMEVPANPCRFCGMDDGCVTHVIPTLGKKGKTMVVKSTCPYHHTTLKYNQAIMFDDHSRCTNVPIICSLCPDIRPGHPRTIWKYNAIFHIVCEH